MINYILGEQRLTVVLQGKSPITVPRDQEERIKKIMTLIQQNDVDALTDELFPAKKITKISNGEIVFDGIHVKWIGSDVAIPRVLGERILDFDTKGFPIKALINFWKNLLSNPSATAREELYGFIEHNDMAITDDGHILAYKKVVSKNNNPVPEKMFGWYIDSSNLVRYSNGQPASETNRKEFADYIASAKITLVDGYSGKFDNSVGVHVSMPRTSVDNDRNITCSHGLHISSYEYAQTYPGDTLVVVKANPRDFVAIPADYDNQKARVCDYDVIGFAEPKQPVDNLYKPGFNEKCSECHYLPEECTCMKFTFEREEREKEEDAYQEELENRNEELERELEEREEENPFSQFDIAVAIDEPNEYFITPGNEYVVREVSGDEILIIDDIREEAWISHEYFESK